MQNSPTSAQYGAHSGKAWIERNGRLISERMYNQSQLMVKFFIVQKKIDVEHPLQQIGLNLSEKLPNSCNPSVSWFLLRFFGLFVKFA